MRIPMTEYLIIDLDTERWVCQGLRTTTSASARGNYKEGTLVYDRDPAEIHQSILDPGKVRVHVRPGPHLLPDSRVLLPGLRNAAGNGVRAAGTPAHGGHALGHRLAPRNMAQARHRPEVVINYGPGEEAVADFTPALGSYNTHNHSAHSFS